MGQQFNASRKKLGHAMLYQPWVNGMEESIRLFHSATWGNFENNSSVKF
jgi:hypothetical protein